MSRQKTLLDIYYALLDQFGYRNWWPADSPFEVIIGAILAQNVSWSNVTKAIDNLKRENLLEPERLFKIKSEELAPLIVSSRFYNQKATKIKNFMNFLYDNYGGDIRLMSKEDPKILRNQLLGIKGLGQETVDSIMLYSCNIPIFVVDSYTKRVCLRYGLLKGDPNYEEIQSYFSSDLPRDVKLYNDFHAQIVHLGNSICRVSPLCDQCPIKRVNDDVSCSYYKIHNLTVSHI